MRRVHIFIATTDGPVKVTSIDSYPPSNAVPPVTSMALVNGGNPAQFSTRYRQFVDVVIRSRFRHEGYFFASVGRDIQHGESWQLGLFLAHVTQADDALTLADDGIGNNDWVILATGGITNRFEITSVAKVVKKFDKARDDLNSWLCMADRVIVVVPKNNDTDVPPEFRTYSRHGNRLTLIASDGVDDLLVRTGLLAGPGRTVNATGRKAVYPADVSSAPKSRKRRWWFGVAAVLCLVAILASEEPVSDTVREVVATSRSIGARIVGEVAKFTESESAPSTLSASRDEDGRNDEVGLAGGSEKEDSPSETELPLQGQLGMSVAPPPTGSSEGHQGANPGGSGPAPAMDPPTVATTGIGGEAARGRALARSEVQEPISPSEWSSPSIADSKSEAVLEPGTDDFDTAAWMSSESEDVRSGFLILPSDAEESVASNARSILRAASRIEQKLIDAGYEVLSRSGFDSELKPNTSRRDLLHLARKQTTARTVVFLQIFPDKRETLSLNQMHAWLEATMVDVDNGNVLAQSTVPALGRQKDRDEWVAIPKRCDRKCEDKAIGDVAVVLAKDAATMILTELKGRESVYSLTIALPRDRRRGIEDRLHQLPGYVRHEQVFTTETRSEWSYVSILPPSQLYDELSYWILEEGIEPAPRLRLSERDIHISGRI